MMQNVDEQSARNRAFGQTRSMSISAVNAIMALQEQARALEKQGEHEQSAARVLKANAISLETSAIYRLQARMRVQTSLTPYLTLLEKQARDARNASRAIDAIIEIFANSDRLINILRRLNGLI